VVEAGDQLDAGTGARRGLAAADNNHDDDDNNHDHHNHHDDARAGSPALRSCTWQGESSDAWPTPLFSGDVERRPAFDMTHLAVPRGRTRPLPVFMFCSRARGLAPRPTQLVRYTPRPRRNDVLVDGETVT
jgi:hypothetical protein